MEDLKRSAQLLVVTDGSGKIISAAWPGVESEGAPTEAGFALPADHVAHELEVPDDLIDAAKPDLSGFRIRTGERGPSLTRAED